MDDLRRALGGRREWFALAVVLVALVLFPAALVGYQALRTHAAGVRVIDVVARAPQQGGFSPDRLQLRAGETVRLRLSSPDVVHGFTIPGLGIDVDEIYPGTVVEVDVTPQKPGRYAFACTRWCGPDHWRMRGVLEVEAAEPPAEASSLELPTTEPPLFQLLGVDIDGPRAIASDLPGRLPSAGRGVSLGVTLPSNLADPTVRRTITPAEAFRRLRKDAGTGNLTDDDVWDLVAWAWLMNADPGARARSETLYARDCAACHGRTGKGDGPAGVSLPGLSKMDPSMPSGPADFTDPSRMLGASDLVLQGKLLRGGMGTGMPEFGSLYTDAELWGMVSHIRSFLLGR
jgi:mono/diheme cytochrome c family protein/plastocyanin